MKDFDKFLKKEKGWVRLFIFMAVIGLIWSIAERDVQYIFLYLVTFFFIYSIAWVVRGFRDKS